MTYEYQKCPVCEQTFSAGDDVVVCPDCGAPHHRACWKEHNHCALEEMHAEGFVWESEGSQPEPEQKAEEQKNDSVCPRCGFSAQKNALVCPNCGFRFGTIPGGFNAFNEDIFLRGVTENPDEDLGGMTVRETALFVQQRAGKYVKKFKRLKDKHTIGWNWAALLFSPFFFFYRKMHKIGFLFLGILMAVNLFIAVPLEKISDEYFTDISKYVKVEENTTRAELAEQIRSLDETQMQGLFSSFGHYISRMVVLYLIQSVPSIFAAMFADTLYRNKIKKDLDTIREYANRDERMEKSLIIRRGGVSPIGAVAALFLFQLFAGLISNL